MSREISVSSWMKLDNGTLKVPKLGGAIYRFDQSLKEQISAVIDVTTGGVTVTTTGLTTPGWAQITNLDPTNYVEYGPYVSSTLHVFGELGPGETHQFKLSATNPTRLKAHTATCKVQLTIFGR